MPEFVKYPHPHRPEHHPTAVDTTRVVRPVTRNRQAPGADTAAMTTPTPAAGWYPDPSNPAVSRWWDGTVWTEHTIPATPSRSVSAASSATASPAGWRYRAGFFERPFLGGYSVAVWLIVLAPFLAVLVSPTSAGLGFAVVGLAAVIRDRLWLTTTGEIPAGAMASPVVWGVVSFFLLPFSTPVYLWKRANRVGRGKMLVLVYAVLMLIGLIVSITAATSGEVLTSS